MVSGLHSSNSLEQLVVAVGRLDENLRLVEPARSFLEFANARVPFRERLRQVAIEGEPLTIQAGAHEGEHDGRRSHQRYDLHAQAMSATDEIGARVGYRGDNRPPKAARGRRLTPSADDPVQILCFRVLVQHLRIRVPAAASPALSETGGPILDARPQTAAKAARRFARVLRSSRQNFPEPGRPDQKQFSILHFIFWRSRWRHGTDTFSFLSISESAINGRPINAVGSEEWILSTK